ncbi:MAG: hypothetical protein HYY96_08510 [Candidatus Tectomicrobia bacterium]|nr:hypothetical protein [Candidatus Tectomicrobia bacterium]
MTTQERLFLAALALGKLSAAELKLCLYLHLRGQGPKSAQGLQIGHEALRRVTGAADKTYVSNKIKRLRDRKVLIRVRSEAGKENAYRLNYDVSAWKGCLDHNVLQENVEQGLYEVWGKRPPKPGTKQMTLDLEGRGGDEDEAL